jgi:hypothetical protein
VTWAAVKTWVVGDPWVVGDVNSYLRDDVQYNRDTFRVAGWASLDMVVWNNASSAVYTDFGGAGKVVVANWVKRQASTDIRIRYSGSAYISAQGTIRMGVKISFTDYDGRPINFTFAATHQPILGVINVTGLAAGTWTATLRCKTLTGGNLTTDANDGMTMEVHEVSAA